MKRNSIIILLLAGLSIIAGHLLSGISLAGRAGINIMYGEYKFLKTWWKASLLVFISWLILYLIQVLVLQTNKRIFGIMQTILLLLAVTGLLFSYYDFQHTLSHRLLDWKFHYGVYLYWIGGLLIIIYQYLAKKGDYKDLNADSVL